jgi:hypothetical protein
MKADSKRLAATLMKRPARILVAGVFLLWGAFFVEHTQEWFIQPFPQHPPLKVCLGQAVHLLMLAGLLVSLRRPWLGSVWVASTAFTFFADKAGARWPVFFGLTVLPVSLLALCAWLDRTRAGDTLRNREHAGAGGSGIFDGVPRELGPECDRDREPS